MISAGAGGRVSLQRVNIGAFTLDIGTVETLTVNGLTGLDTMSVNSLAGVAGLTAVNLFGNADVDTFSIVPSATAVIVVNGGLPNPPGMGDVLSVSTAGTTNPTLTVSSSASGYAGSYNFGNAQAVTFRWMESISPLPDLTVSKTDAPDPVAPGSNITYTITVTNNGAVAAAAVNLNDAIPADTTIIPYRTISFSTSVACAPSAMRIPISCVRCVTM